MLYPMSPGAHRRRRLIAVTVAVALLLIAFLAYAVLAHRARPVHGPIGHARAVEPTSTATNSTREVTRLPELKATNDPEKFARSVAEALFAWDTTTLVTRTDHVEQLIAVADPTGESTVGLASDLDNYLPTDDAWAQLTQYETKQWLTINSITTPTLWPEAEAQAGSELQPGTTAFTIHSIRHRSGVWDDAPVETSHEVAFTVFIVCGPSYPTCHLLRLSILDRPLD